MRCNLITDTENTAGLATDVELLSAFLRGLGHEVAVGHWQHVSPRADVNFYLERFAPWHFATAKRHVGIFNLEWLREEWIIHLPFMTQIWAKSAIAYEWFMEHGLDQVRFTGFLSRDTYETAICKDWQVLHLAGQSTAKNTNAVLQAYREAPALGVKLPRLTIVWRGPIVQPPPNVDHLYGQVERSHLDAMLNWHRFHLCPSEVEGWGHYITEATACGGVVITTDASPMNEHVLPTFGRLLTPVATRRVGLVDRHEVSSKQIIEALLELNALPDAELDAMGERARAWNRKRNAAFEASATALVKELEA